MNSVNLSKTTGEEFSVESSVRALDQHSKRRDQLRKVRSQQRDLNLDRLKKFKNLTKSRMKKQQFNSRVRFQKENHAEGKHKNYRRPFRDRSSDSGSYSQVGINEEHSLTESNPNVTPSPTKLSGRSSNRSKASSSHNYLKSHKLTRGAKKSGDGASPRNIAKKEKLNLKPSENRTRSNLNTLENNDVMTRKVFYESGSDDYSEGDELKKIMRYGLDRRPGENIPTFPRFKKLSRRADSSTERSQQSVGSSSGDTNTSPEIIKESLVADTHKTRIKSISRPRKLKSKKVDYTKKSNNLPKRKAQPSYRFGRTSKRKSSSSSFGSEYQRHYNKKTRGQDSEISLESSDNSEVELDKMELSDISTVRHMNYESLKKLRRNGSSKASISKFNHFGTGRLDAAKSKIEEDSENSSKKQPALNKARRQIPNYIFEEQRGSQLYQNYQEDLLPKRVFLRVNTKDNSFERESSEHTFDISFKNSTLNLKSSKRSKKLLEKVLQDSQKSNETSPQSQKKPQKKNKSKEKTSTKPSPQPKTVLHEQENEEQSVSQEQKLLLDLNQLKRNSKPKAMKNQTRPKNSSDLGLHLPGLRHHSQSIDVRHKMLLSSPTRTRRLKNDNFSTNQENLFKSQFNYEEKSDAESILENSSEEFPIILISSSSEQDSEFEVSVNTEDEELRLSSTARMKDNFTNFIKKLSKYKKYEFFKSGKVFIDRMRAKGIEMPPKEKERIKEEGRVAKEKENSRSQRYRRRYSEFINSINTLPLLSSQQPDGKKKSGFFDLNNNKVPYIQRLRELDLPLNYKLYLIAVDDLIGVVKWFILIHGVPIYAAAAYMFVMGGAADYSESGFFEKLVYLVLMPYTFIADSATYNKINTLMKPLIILFVAGFIFWKMFKFETNVLLLKRKERSRDKIIVDDEEIDTEKEFEFLKCLRLKNTGFTSEEQIEKFVFRVIDGQVESQRKSKKEARTSRAQEVKSAWRRTMLVRPDLKLSLIDEGDEEKEVEKAISKWEKRKKKSKINFECMVIHDCLEIDKLWDRLTEIELLMFEMRVQKTKAEMKVGDINASVAPASSDILQTSRIGAQTLLTSKTGTTSLLGQNRLSSMEASKLNFKDKWKIKRLKKRQKRERKKMLEDLNLTNSQKYNELKKMKDGLIKEIKLCKINLSGNPEILASPYCFIIFESFKMAKKFKSLLQNKKRIRNLGYPKISASYAPDAYDIDWNQYGRSYKCCRNFAYYFICFITFIVLPSISFLNAYTVPQMLATLMFNTVNDSAAEIVVQRNLLFLFFRLLMSSLVSVLIGIWIYAYFRKRIYKTYMARERSKFFFYNMYFLLNVILADFYGIIMTGIQGFGSQSVSATLKAYHTYLFMAALKVSFSIIFSPYLVKLIDYLPKIWIHIKIFLSNRFSIGPRVTILDMLRRDMPVMHNIVDMASFLVEVIFFITFFESFMMPVINVILFASLVIFEKTEHAMLYKYHSTIKTVHFDSILSIYRTSILGFLILQVLSFSNMNITVKFLTLFNVLDKLKTDDNEWDFLFSLKLILKNIYQLIEDFTDYKSVYEWLSAILLQLGIVGLLSFILYILLKWQFNQSKMIGRLIGKLVAQEERDRSLEKSTIEQISSVTLARKYQKTSLKLPILRNITSRQEFINLIELELFENRHIFSSKTLKKRWRLIRNNFHVLLRRKKFVNVKKILVRIKRGLVKKKMELQKKRILDGRVKNLYTKKNPVEKIRNGEYNLDKIIL